MIKVVIDTNCLLASIPPNSQYYWLYEHFSSGRFQWILSTEILLEYEEKLQEFYSENTARLVLSILSTSPNVTFQEPYFRWSLISNDVDDNKFVDLAIHASCDYLVTNDHHFDVLKQLDFPKVNVVSIAEFKNKLSNATK